MKELIDELRELGRADSWAAETLRNAADALESQSREIERLNAVGLANEKLTQRIKELKAKPSGVVLPERLDIPHRDEFESADHYAAAVGEANKWNACLDEVARLNQPASAGDERPIASCLRGQFETWAMETEHPVFGYIGSDWLDHGDDPNTYANDYMQGAWVMLQARAQLAAPAGVVVPPALFDQAISWIEDRRRYGDEGTLPQVWHELKTIQRDWRTAAPSPAPTALMCATMQRPVSECGCPDCGSSLIDWPAPAGKSNQKPIQVETVAVTRKDEDGELYLDWLLEGGISALEHAGQTLLIAHGKIADDCGSGTVYTQARADLSANHSEQVRDCEDWSVFVGYLIDNCEGDTVAEEGLQGWLADMIADPHYGALFRREKTADGKPVDRNLPIAMSIEAAEEEHGSLRAAAKALGIDAGYLSRLKSGEKLNPGDDVLSVLGLERVTMYRAAAPSAGSQGGDV